jgi:hypothetical protein
VLRSKGGTMAPGANAEQQEEHAEDELAPRDCVAGGAVGGGVGEVIGDAADDGERDDPADQECRSVDPRALREEHQRDSDDRQGADRHANRRRQDSLIPFSIGLCRC